MINRYIKFFFKDTDPEFNFTENQKAIITDILSELFQDFQDEITYKVEVAVQKALDPLNDENN